MLAQPSFRRQTSFQRQCLTDLDPNSPFSAYPPVYFASAYPASTPSPSERSTRQQRHQSTAETASNSVVDCNTPYTFASYPSMPTSSNFSGPTTQVRVQPSVTQTSPATSSPSRVSMQAEQERPQTNWLYYDDNTNGGDFSIQSRLSGLQQKQLAERVGSGGAGRRINMSSNAGSGSNSPFSQSSTSHSFIAQSEASPGFPSAFDSPRQDQMASADQASSFRFSKAPPTPSHTPSQDSFLAPAFQNYNPETQNSSTNMEAHLEMMRGLKMQSHMSNDNTPALSPTPQRLPGYSGASVSSLSYHSPAPATPQTTNGDDFEDGFNVTSSDFQPLIPKLERTITDVYSDELFPTYGTSQSRHSQQNGNSKLSTNTLLSPYRNVFNERIHAAQSAHQTQSPTSSVSRERSPFRHGSPYATQNTMQRSPQVAFGSAAQMREQNHAEAAASELRRQMDHEYESGHLNTPKTISPKDAVLEYHGSEDDSSLFPDAQHQSNRLGNISGSIQGEADDSYTERSYNSLASSRRPSSTAFSMAGAGNFTFAPPSVPGSVQLPQQYPFVPQQRRPNGDMASPSSRIDRTPEFPATLTSMESSMSDAGAESSSDVTAEKPLHTKADSGTYTCTYHGCTLRFETPAKLQKHKREGHRQINAHNPHVQQGMTSAGLLRNSQAGPHRCDRINPSTGKPCNTIFSRPYDLTRHEDTIHNARKQKVRCQLCTEEKSFSRNDALTRHMRVVHPEVEFGGRNRRKHQD